MTAYSVRVMENGRIATRGLSRRRDGVSIELDGGEAVPVVIDWSGWLGGDAIASADSAGQVITETTSAVTINGSTSAGVIEHRITTQQGAVKMLPIYVNGFGFRSGGYRPHGC